ncbi:MAG: hypothetical protein WCJ19_03490 [bacterium]
MELEKYLKQIIQLSEYELTADDIKKIQFEGIEKYVIDKLNLSKYRSTSIPYELLQKITNIVNNSIKNSKPIHVTVPFGGFKKWQLMPAPNPDWSEILNFIFLREYLLPICTVYKPGIILDYFSDEVFVSRMNNYSQEDLDNYNNKFQDILKYFKNFVPYNFKIKYSYIRDEISQVEIMKRFEEDIPKLKLEWNKLSDKDKKDSLQKTERNYKCDYSKISEQEKYEKIFDSCMVHEAFVNGKWDHDIPWAFAEDMIPLGFVYTKKWGIHLKSSVSSTVQFWVGVGALKFVENSIIPTILTYEQFKTLKPELVKINIFSADMDYLNKILVIK